MVGFAMSQEASLTQDKTLSNDLRFPPFTALLWGSGGAHSNSVLSPVEDNMVQWREF